MTPVTAREAAPNIERKNQFTKANFVLGESYSFAFGKTQVGLANKGLPCEQQSGNLQYKQNTCLRIASSPCYSNLTVRRPETGISHVITSIIICP